MRLRCTPIRCRRPSSAMATATLPGRRQAARSRRRIGISGASQGSWPRHRRIGVAELTAHAASRRSPRIDVAGAGGTSWSRVEQLVRYGELRFPTWPTGGYRRRRRSWRCGGRCPFPAGRFWRYSHRYGRGKSAGFGRRRRRDRSAATGCGDRIFWAVVDWLQRFIDELGICLHGAGAGRSSGAARDRRHPNP